MKNILFLTAYSDHSKEVYRYALKLAQQFGAGITLYHIYNGETPKSKKNQELEEQTKKLSTFAKENTLLSTQVPLTIKIGSGDFLTNIQDIEQSLRPDLIVMGMTKRKRSDKIFGQLSLKVIKQSKTPVLLIPPGIKMEEIQKIIYASYLASSDDEKAIRYLMNWGKAFSATIDVLNVCEKHNLERNKMKLSQLQEKFTGESLEAKISFQLKEGVASKMIKEYEEFTQADLLVLTSQHSGFWAQLFEPAITKQIARETHIPLLVLKQ